MQSFRLYNYIKFTLISCLQLLQKSKTKCGKNAHFRDVGTPVFWGKFGKVRTSVFLQSYRLYNYVKFSFISCLQLLQKSKSNNTTTHYYSSATITFEFPAVSCSLPVCLSHCCLVCRAPKQTTTTTNVQKGKK